MLFIDSLPLLRRSNPKSWAGLRWNVALTDRGNSSSPDPTDVTPYNFSRHQLHHRLAHSYNISTIRFQFQSLPFSPCVTREFRRGRSRAAKVEPILESWTPEARRATRRFKKKGGKLEKRRVQSVVPSFPHGTTQFPDFN